MFTIKNKVTISFVISSVCTALGITLHAQNKIVLFQPEKDAIEISSAPILIDPQDNKTITKAAQLFQSDLEKTTNQKHPLWNTLEKRNTIILAGDLQSKYIQQLVQSGKIKVQDIENQWEKFKIFTLKNPFPKVKNAIVILGSDRRGTAFGMMELSRQMGVSPWNWWADVPVTKHPQLFIAKNAIIEDAPKVKYRGIFINDEEPALGPWAREKFGGINHLFYGKVFELLLRLKANFMWPAMWGKSFNNDDSLNFPTADTFGIVMGNSHHEPLMRAQAEWHKYGKGHWDFTKNKAVLNQFWNKGMESTKPYEKVVTIGMRGDGDEPMQEGTATKLLEDIVKDQREIIAKTSGKPAEETPQLWALYKEVQDYYDAGMRVPDDVTLLLSDDNWGNIRRLPNLQAKPRKGGYGIYYHLDYVGDPRNYKWINTNNISRIWEQMNLAYQYDAKQIWILNVGDLKPMEFPINFFLDYAWNPDQIKRNDLRQYSIHWSQEQFGKNVADSVAYLIDTYAQFSARRKPELINENSFSLQNYNEFSRLTGDFIQLHHQAISLENKIQSNQKDAYYQLVLHPIEALSNLYKLYFYTALNHQAYKDWNMWSNVYADSVKQLYLNDSMISLKYNRLNHGKWNHMMDQTHIGYTYWQQPDNNSMPTLQYRPPGDKYIGKEIKPEAVINPMTSTKNPIFQAENGYVSILANHFTSAKQGIHNQWETIYNIGRESDGMETFPVNVRNESDFATMPQLKYLFQATSKDSIKLHTFYSPTLNFMHSKTGLRIAIAIDDETPQIISINKDESDHLKWQQWVANNVIEKISMHHLGSGNNHTITVYGMDPGIVLQKLIIDLGGLQKSYLGPQETFAKP